MKILKKSGKHLVPCLHVSSEAKVLTHDHANGILRRRVRKSTSSRSHGILSCKKSRSYAQACCTRPLCLSSMCSLSFKVFHEFVRMQPSPHLQMPVCGSRNFQDQLTQELIQCSNVPCCQRTTKHGSQGRPHVPASGPQGQACKAAMP